MKKIEIEDDLYKYILTNIEAFGETPSQILRRLLALPAADESIENHPEQPVVISVPREEKITAAVNKGPKPSPIEYSAPASLPDAFAHGIAALFADPVFKNETVITNKFKMMLTTMYHENRPAFIVAANHTKGRTRDYLGQNLTVLLASDNEDEVAQLKASKPHEIPYTPFWVITNANTGRKRIILTQMMASMGYPHHLIERINEEI